MRFMATFTYDPKVRERLLKFLHGGGLDGGSSLKVAGAWLSAQTGTGYAVLEADDARAIYDLSVSWSEFGQINLTPVIPVKDL